MDGGAAAEGGGGGAAAGGAILNGIAPPPFLSKTYDMVDDPATDSIVSWGRGNTSFVVWSAPEFARDLLPKYFKHNNFSSFVRQLNTYGFRKVDPDRWEFANEGFVKGQKHLLKTITRRKATHVQNQPQQTQAQNTSVGACVEVGNFGLEEEIERLKRDKNVLMQELVRLRQQQQSTDHQLQTLGQRLQGMEQRQQQMMSFLAKAMQSPGFLAQLVHQNDSNRRIVAGNKKRRLPRQDIKLNGQSTSPDGQIIKYQPLMNEAAKAMLRQILKADTSMLEPFSNFDNLVLEKFPSSLETLDSRSTPSRNSGVTLSEVPGNSVLPNIPTSSAFSAICSSPAQSEIQSPTGFANMDVSMLSGVADAVSSSQTGISIPDFPQIPEMIPNSKPVDLPVRNYAAPEAQNVHVDALFEGVDRPISIETEEYPVDTDFDILIDEDHKLPGINDSFWEQFLKSPVLGEAEEADSSTLEAEIQHGLENGWDSSQNLKSLTEQMELLASGVKM